MAGGRFLRYIVWRLLQAVPVILGVTVLCFLMLQLAPGDLATVLAGEAGGASPGFIEELRARYALDNDPWQPRANIMAGAAYLREMHDRYGSIAAMLAAYNAGPTRYDAHLANGRALPAETVDYVAKIAPLIGGKVPVMRLAGIGSRASWSRGPIFVGRSLVHPDDASTTSDLPSNRPSNAPAIGCPIPRR